MAAQVLTASQLYIDGHDFTGDVHTAGFDAQVDVKKATTYASGSWDEFIAGVLSGSLSAEGFLSLGATSVEATEWAANGTADRVVTYAPVGTEATAAYLLRAVRSSYQTFGAHGEVAPFSVSASTSHANGIVRGRLALAKTSGISSTGAVGTGVELGAVAADEYLYASLHIFPTAGTTITVIVESDDNSGFTTPTTRATIGPVTAVGGTWLTRVAGPITDSFFRLNVSAVTGSFTAAGAIAVQ